MKNQKAFTLIELLVVLGIIAILAAITLPRVKQIIQSNKAVHSQGASGYNSNRDYSRD